MRKHGISILSLLILTSLNSLLAQDNAFNYFYRIYFRDKGEYTVSGFYATDLLSPKAIARREKYGIPAPDYKDLPVFQDYIRQVKESGLTLHCTSRWMNTGLFKSVNPIDTSILQSLSFIRKIKIVKIPAAKGSQKAKVVLENQKQDLPPFDRPLTMINGNLVHNMGFDGKDITIAVLDAGFISANQIPALGLLRIRGGIKGTRDFVLNRESVYDYSNHGTAVLSILAGLIPDQLEGSAPGADYWLLRTEDVFSEFPAEEDYWAAGAEYADSLGADIISSSLGYFKFDDPAMDYTYQNMDGKTAFITRAADIAASKGILVVNSAGNERNNPWLRIIAPSDGDSVLAVGAVDGYGTISSFSSAGPSYDRRVKPDIVAQGVSVPLQTTTDSMVYRGSGTSFSCPVISGMCACILQAVPEATDYDIIIALHSSADRYLAPDSLYGYGIPDIIKAITILKANLVSNPGGEPSIGPNPFTTDLMIRFEKAPLEFSVEVFNFSGSMLAKRTYTGQVNRSVYLHEFRYLPAGLYFIRVTTQSITHTFKVIKVRN